MLRLDNCCVYKVVGPQLRLSCPHIRNSGERGGNLTINVSSRAAKPGWHTHLSFSQYPLLGCNESGKGAAADPTVKSYFQNNRGVLPAEMIC